MAKLNVETVAQGFAKLLDEAERELLNEASAHIKRAARIAPSDTAKIAECIAIAAALRIEALKSVWFATSLRNGIAGESLNGPISILIAHEIEIERSKHAETVAPASAAVN